MTDTTMPRPQNKAVAATPTSDASSTLRDVLRALARHKKKAIFVFALAMGSAMLAARFLPKTYRSEGKLLVRLGRENATLDNVTTLGQEPVMAPTWSRENEINSLVEVLRSRTMVEHVVDALGPEAVLDPQPPSASDGADASGEDAPAESRQANLTGRLRDGVETAKGWLFGADAAPTLTRREKAVMYLQRQISIVPARKSTVIGIVCKGPSPEWSQRVVSKLIDLYLADHIRLNRPQGSLEFFAEQTARLRAELTQKEQGLQDLKSATGIASSEEQGKAIVRRASELQVELTRTETALAASRAIVRQLRSQLEDLPEKQVTALTSGYGNQGTDLMRDELYRLQLKREEAASKYSEEHPAMRQIEEQLRVARQIMDRQEPTRNQTTTATNPLYEQIRASLLEEESALVSWQAKQGELRTQLAGARCDLQTFTKDELHIAQLQRDVDLLSADYRTYAASVERARIDHSLQSQRMSNLSVVQDATCETKPIGPHKAVLLALGLLSGLLGGLAVALAAEWRSGRLCTAEDVEKRLNVAVLGEIPRLRPTELHVHGNGNGNGNGNGSRRVAPTPGTRDSETPG